MSKTLASTPSDFATLPQANSALLSSSVGAPSNGEGSDGSAGPERHFVELYSIIDTKPN